MDRVTARVPKKQLDEIEAMVDRGLYPNQSEAIRAAIRLLIDERGEDPRKRATADGGRPDRPAPSEERPDYFTEWSQP